LAIYYSKNDNANLCHNCNEKYHKSQGKLLEKHDIVSIKERPEDFGRCDSHPNQSSQFYCEKCNALLCIYCKISGNHSSGEYAGHTITPISEEYRKALLESGSPDALTEKYKSMLRSKLKKVDENITLIKANLKACEDTLLSKLKTALENLHSQAQTKFNVLIADQIELRRRYEEIQLTESFLRYQSEVLKPQDYLKSWFR
jgi:hypothetical protein